MKMIVSTRYIVRSTALHKLNETNFLQNMDEDDVSHGYDIRTNSITINGLFHNSLVVRH